MRRLSLLKSLIESSSAPPQDRKEMPRSGPISSARPGRASMATGSAWRTTSAAAIKLRKLLNGGKVTLAGRAGDNPWLKIARAESESRRRQGGHEQLDAAWQEWLRDRKRRDGQWLGGPSASRTSRSRRASVHAARTIEKPWPNGSIFINSNLELSNGPLASFATFLLSPEGQRIRGRAATAFRRHFYRLWVEEAFSHRQSLRGSAARITNRSSPASAIWIANGSI